MAAGGSWVRRVSPFGDMDDTEDEDEPTGEDDCRWEWILCDFLWFWFKSKFALFVSWAQKSLVSKLDILLLLVHIFTSFRSILIFWFLPIHLVFAFCTNCNFYFFTQTPTVTFRVAPSTKCILQLVFAWKQRTSVCCSGDGSSMNELRALRRRLSTTRNWLWDSRMVEKKKKITHFPNKQIAPSCCLVSLGVCKHKPLREIWVEENTAERRWGGKKWRKKKCFQT